MGNRSGGRKPEEQPVKGQATRERQPIRGQEITGAMGNASWGRKLYGKPIKGTRNLRSHQQEGQHQFHACMF
jgi:hypothetical protein